MRTDLRLALLTLPLVVLGACSRGDVQITAVKKVSPPASSSADLAIAQPSFQRMRFVSDLERANSTKAPLRTSRNSSSRGVRPAMMMKPLAVAATETNIAAPALGVAAPQIAEPARMAMGRMSDEVLDHANDMSSGGQEGGFVSNVVIRGGRAGNGKCDPRTDTHTTPQEIGRPDFAMPQPTGRVFGHK